MEIIRQLPGVNLFLSEAAGEVLKMYVYDVAELRQGMKVFRDSTASSVPVTFLYGGDYHTVVIGPASSNTVATCVAGISDTLATNIYAQAGKCRIPSIVFETLFVTPQQFRSVPRPTYPEIRVSLLPFSGVKVQIESFAPDAVHIATEGPLGMAARRRSTADLSSFTWAAPPWKRLSRFS